MTRQIRSGKTRKRNPAQTAATVAASVVAIGVLTGCTTFKPYVLPTSPNSDKPEEPLPRTFCDDARAVTYDLLHTYARHANQHEQIQKWGALGLLPLAGVVAYKSIVAPNLGDIVGLSAAGGAGLAALNFLSTNQQERIYTAGMEALSCALAVIEPTMLPDDLQTDFKAATAQLAKFRSFVAAFQPQSGTNGMFEKAGADSQGKLMLSAGDRKKLERIADVFDSGIRETMQRLQSKYPGWNSAERRLCQATLRIAGSVNRQLAEASPDLASISGKLTAFTSFPTINVPTTGTPGTPAREAAAVGDASISNMLSESTSPAAIESSPPVSPSPVDVAQISGLREARNIEEDVARAVRKLANDVDSLPDAETAPPIASIADTCKVEMVAPPPSLTVVHSGDTEGTVTLKAGQVFEVLVRASGQMPHIDVVPSKTGGNFTVSEVELKDGAFVRTVTVVEMPDPKFPNSMSVSVASENNQTVTTIKLEIEPTPSEAGDEDQQ